MFVGVPGEAATLAVGCAVRVRLPGPAAGRVFQRVAPRDGLREVAEEVAFGDSHALSILQSVLKSSLFVLDLLA